MSYDITLIDPQPGESIEQALDRIEGQDLQPIPTEAQQEVFAAIAAEVADEGYEYLAAERYVNIVNDNFGAIFDLRINGATVNVAYWHSGDDAGKTMRSVVGLVGRIREATGWTAYDPQRGTVIDDFGELALDSSNEMDRITRWADQNIRSPKRP